jgi:hypothetical protein
MAIDAPRQSGVGFASAAAISSPACATGGQTMAVQIFHSDDIPQEALPPAMKFLLTKWNTLTVMNRLTLQAITESASFNVADNSAYMIPAGDNFFFMHMGKNVAAGIGQDLTGRLMSTVSNTIAHDLIDAYQQTVAQQKPSFLRFTTDGARHALVWERLVLPVSVDGLGTLLVCFSEVLSHQQGVFEYLFQNARNPWIVTYPIFTGGIFDDGWVLMMNAAARAAFSYDHPIDNLRLREFPLFQFGALWERLRESYAEANPRTTVGFDQIDLELIKVKHLLAFRFDHNGIAAGPLPS